MTKNLSGEKKDILKKIQEISIEVDKGMKELTDAQYRANYRSELIVTLFNSLKVNL